MAGPLVTMLTPTYCALTNHLRSSSGTASDQSPPDECLCNIITILIQNTEVLHEEEGSGFGETLDTYFSSSGNALMQC